MREIIILLEVYPQLFHKEVLAKPPEFCKCLYNTGELITKHRDCLDSRK